MHEQVLLAVGAPSGHREALRQKGWRIPRFDGSECDLAVEPDQVRVGDTEALPIIQFIGDSFQQPRPDPLALSCWVDLHSTQHDRSVLWSETNDSDQLPLLLRQQNGVRGLNPAAVATTEIELTNPLQILVPGTSDGHVHAQSGDQWTPNDPRVRGAGPARKPVLGR